MSVTLRMWIEDGYVRFTCPYDMRHLVKEIPGYAWVGEDRHWRLPLATDTISRLIELFQPHHIVLDRTIDEFLSRDTRGKRERGERFRNTPAIPITYGPEPWDHQRGAFYFVLQRWGLTIDQEKDETPDVDTLDALPL